MSTTREAFLQGVRQALAAGPRSRPKTEFVSSARVGYQGGGPDPVNRFCAEFKAAGGFPYLVPNASAAIAQVLELVRSKAARRILLGSGPVLEQLPLAEQLRSAGLEVVQVADLSPESCRAQFFAAEVAISGVDYLVAETGTIVCHSSPSEPRSLSLLAPIHIALAQRRQLVPDLFDYFDLLNAKVSPNGEPALPSCLSLITGPSKTGDIELRLVTGVHGPGEVHLLLMG